MCVSDVSVYDKFITDINWQSPSVGTSHRLINLFRSVDTHSLCGTFGYQPSFNFMRGDN